MRTAKQRHASGTPVRRPGPGVPINEATRKGKYPERTAIIAKLKAAGERLDHHTIAHLPLTAGEKSSLATTAGELMNHATTPAPSE